MVSRSQFSPTTAATCMLRQGRGLRATSYDFHTPIKKGTKQRSFLVLLRFPPCLHLTICECGRCARMCIPELWRAGLVLESLTPYSTCHTCSAARNGRACAEKKCTVYCTVHCYWVLCITSSWPQLGWRLTNTRPVQQATLSAIEAELHPHSLNSLNSLAQLALVTR